MDNNGFQEPPTHPDPDTQPDVEPIDVRLMFFSVGNYMQGYIVYQYEEYPDTKILVNQGLNVPLSVDPELRLRFFEVTKDMAKLFIESVTNIKAEFSGLDDFTSKEKSN